MKRVLLALGRGYQRTFSWVLPTRCRFFPSCSQYYLEAVERHGAMVERPGIVRSEPERVVGTCECVGVLTLRNLLGRDVRFPVARLERCAGCRGALRQRRSAGLRYRR